MSALVIYHSPCNDGFTSAWIAYNALTEKNILTDLYLMNYGPEECDRLLEYLRDRTYQNIYVVDFSIPPIMLNNIVYKRQSLQKIQILDHHKTACGMYGYSEKEFLDGMIVDEYYDREQKIHLYLRNDMSGAGICWNYFIASPQEDALWIVKYVQDYDLWRFKFPNTKAVIKFMSTKEQTISTWNSIARQLESPIQHREIVREGNRLLEIEKLEIDKIVATAKECFLDGATGLAVYTPDPTMISKIGHELANASGTYGCCYRLSDDGMKINCSLRSNEAYDVSVIAKTYGGSGHKNAAGFSIPVIDMLEAVYLP